MQIPPHLFIVLIMALLVSCSNSQSSNQTTRTDSEEQVANTDSHEEPADIEFDGKADPGDFHEQAGPTEIPAQPAFNDSDFQAAVKKIEKSLATYYKGKLEFKGAALSGGIAIIGYLNNSAEAAFWSNDKVIYAANGSAMAWTENSFGYSPAGIDFVSVLRAVE